MYTKQEKFLLGMVVALLVLLVLVTSFFMGYTSTQAQTRSHVVLPMATVIPTAIPEKFAPVTEHGINTGCFVRYTVSDDTGLTVTGYRCMGR